MAALAVPSGVPMAVEQLVVNVRLYFTFCFFSIAARVARFVRAIGIYAGNECDGLSVGRPDLVVRSSGKKSNSVHCAAFDIHRKNLWIAFNAAGDKRQLLTVGRPPGPRIAAAARQLTWLAAAYAHDPYVA